MKLHAFLLPLVAAVLFAGCDKLDEPVIRLNNQYLEGVYGPAPEFATLDNPTKNVLVEEFTGHLCGFCPPATAMLKALDEELGERLVPITVHAGTLAAVTASPYETDFTTEAGDIYWAQLENGFNPAARIDRTGGISNFYVDNQWSSKIDEQLDEAPRVAMQMVTQYAAEDQNLNIHVHTQFLQSLQGRFQLIVLLLESHIISAQSDYSLDPSTIYDYEHNHLLRTNITNALGEPLLTNPLNNDQVVKSYTLPMSDLWVPENCSVVAFVIDPITGEVINAVEDHVEL
jgi:hypothetical protein